MAGLVGLATVPGEVLKHIVSFLDYKDALRASGVNKSFHITLSLSTLGSVPLMDDQTWRNSDDEPHKSVWIPIMFPHRTHSVVLTCRWSDQGWGNRKGGLFVVAVPEEGDPNADTLSRIENGEIVHESPIAPHDESPLCMSFHYSPFKAYYLWYRVGGGGGHQLKVKNLEARAIIHDDTGKWVLKNYTALRSQDALLPQSIFYVKLLRAAALSLEEQLEKGEADVHLLTMLESSDISVTLSSVKALVDLANALMEFQVKKCDHASLEAVDMGELPPVFRAAAMLERGAAAEIELAQGWRIFARVADGFDDEDDLSD